MNHEEQERYQRQIQLIGEAGQEKLSAAKVLIVGMGGLGNAVLPILVGAGVGDISIMDGDRVSLSNLHRQPLFSQSDVDEWKVEVAARVMHLLNPAVRVSPISQHLSGHNALKLFSDFDLIVDATDRVPIRYLIDHAAVLTGKPFVHAAIYQFQAQVSVFNYQGGPTYRCLYPEPPQVVKACDEVGVMGSTVALAGSLQAQEVFKMILGIGEVASGKLLMIDGLANQIQTFTFQKNQAISTSPEDFYKLFQQPEAPRISLEDAIAQRCLLLDVRQPEESPQMEQEVVLQIPMSQLEDRWQEIDSGKPVAIFCQSGARAAKAWQQLTRHGLSSLFCLNEQADSVSQYFSYEETKNRIH